jgi:predicted 2-oxoglutarate/Fe(II)-dependent dioxygenase YbiX
MTDVIEIENFLSGGECNRLIKIHKKLFVSQGWLHNETEVLDFMCMLSSQNENDIFIKYIHGKITDHIKSANKSNFINYFQVVKWKEGLSMQKHFDFDFHTWTSVIYLNDDYEGGETVVGDKEVVPLKGKIVTFQGVSVLHGVNKVLKGDRYTVPVWYRSA